MSFTTLRTVCSISSSAPGAQPPLSPQRSGSYIGLQRISPASTTRWVVVRVSQATRDSGSFDRNRSKIASEIWADTLAGWPSETLSEVNRYSARIRAIPPRGWQMFRRGLTGATAQRNRGDGEQYRGPGERQQGAEPREQGGRQRGRDRAVNPLGDVLRRDLAHHAARVDPRAVFGCCCALFW